MIDDFLNELFGPDTGGPASFGDRFGAMGGVGAALGAPQPAPGLDPMAFAERFRGGPDAPTTMDMPMPPPRPDVASMLSGGVEPDMMRRVNSNFLQMNGGRDPSGRQVLPADDGMTLPPGATLNQGKAPAGMTGTPSIADRLMGVINDPLNRNADPEAGGATGIAGRLMGMDAGREKRLRSAIAGGLSGANPAFGAGAFAKGVSGGTAAALKSDKDDLETETAADEREQKQGNFERAQTDKEKTSAALRKLYGDRGETMKTNAATRAANPPGSGRGTAWNKPPHERWRDAQKLIIDKNKELDRSLPLVPKPEDVARIKGEKDKFRADTLRRYGIDENGNDAAPQPAAPGSRTQTPSSGRVVGDREGVDRGLYDRDQTLTAARTAIARGANPEQVKQRLREHGIAFEDADLDMN